MLHGGAGENGTIQGLLDLLQIPYQCAGVLGCALAMDKPRAKALFRAAGLPVARDLLLHRRQPKPVAKILEHFAPPLVVKPAGDGSSVEVSIVRYKSHLAPALRKAFACGDEVLGRGVSWRPRAGPWRSWAPARHPPAVLALPPHPALAIFAYEAPSPPGASAGALRPGAPPRVAARVQAMACPPPPGLGLQGYARRAFIPHPGRQLHLGPPGPGMTAAHTPPAAPGRPPPAAPSPACWPASSPWPWARSRRAAARSRG